MAWMELWNHQREELSGEAVSMAGQSKREASRRCFLEKLKDLMGRRVWRCLLWTGCH